MQLKRHWRPWLVMPAVIVVAAFVVVACGGAASGSVASPSAAGGAGGGAPVSTNKVLIANSAFTPQAITVAAGTTVTWTNKDPMPHDVTSATDISTSASTTSLFGSGTLNQGQSFSFTFSKAGTYYYECQIHATQASMHGEVVVQ